MPNISYIVIRFFAFLFAPIGIILRTLRGNRNLGKEAIKEEVSISSEAGSMDTRYCIGSGVVKTTVPPDYYGLLIAKRIFATVKALSVVYFIRDVSLTCTGVVGDRNKSFHNKIQHFQCNDEINPELTDKCRMAFNESFVRHSFDYLKIHPCHLKVVLDFHGNAHAILTLTIDGELTSYTLNLRE